MEPQHQLARKSLPSFFFVLMLFHFAITAATVIVLLSQSDGVSGSSTSEFPDPGATPVPSAGPPQLPGYGPDVDPSTLLSPGNNITLVAQMLDGPTDEFIQTFGNLSSTQYLMGERSQAPWAHSPINLRYTR